MSQRKYPATPKLKRPQKYQNYFHKESLYRQRTEKLTLEDIDKEFDFDDEEDSVPPSPVEETQASVAQVPKGKVPHSATPSNRPVMDIEVNSPFKNLASFKTSSPIERDETSSSREGVEQADIGRVSPSPILFPIEVPGRILQMTTDMIETFEVSSPPERITLKKNRAPLKELVKPQQLTFEVESPQEITFKKNPAPLKKVEAPQKETGPGASKTLKESEMPVEVRRERPKQGNGDKLVSAGNNEPQHTAQERKSKIPILLKVETAPQQGNGPPPVMAVRREKPQNTAREKTPNELKETPAPSKNLAAPHKETGPRQKPQNTPQEPPVEKSSCVETNFHTFLQKIKEAQAARPKPAHTTKMCLPIRAPTPPVEEDEFRVVLEEDVPLYQLSRRNKRPCPKQGETGTSYGEVKGSADKISNVTQPQEAEKCQVLGGVGSMGNNQTGKITSKEHSAAEKAEEEPRNHTIGDKESMEMKKGGQRSRAGKERQDAKERPAKATKQTREWLQVEPEDAVELQSQELPGKGHGGQTRVKSTKETRETIQVPDSVELQGQEPPGRGHGGLHEEKDVCSAEQIGNPGRGRNPTSNDLAASNTERHKTYSPVLKTSSPVVGKRKRKPPGEWWRSDGQDTEQNAVEAQNVDAIKISQHGEVKKTQKKKSEPGQKAKKNGAALTKVRKGKKQHHTPEKATAALSEQVQNPEELQQQADSLVCPLGEASITTGDRLFDRINQHTEVNNKQASDMPKTIPDHIESRLPQKLRRKAVVADGTRNAVEIPAIQQQKPNSKSPKIRRKSRIQKMSAFEDDITTTPTTETRSNDRNQHQKMEGKRLFPVQEDEASRTIDEFWPSKNNTFSFRNNFDKLQSFASGPSSMIAQEAYEEPDTLVPSPGISHSTLSATELCLYPLKPVTVQACDEEIITKWFWRLWPATVKTAGQMNTDAFKWFSYRSRIIGVCEDILRNNWCAGRMLLGSHGHKPLWVDHSAETVYNVLTSAVSVTIDGTVSQYNPGLSFSVPCGHAYDIKNLTDEPAVLYFNRMRCQSADAFSSFV